MPFLRAAFLVLAWLLAAASMPADGETRPAIFAEAPAEAVRVRKTLEPPDAGRSRLPISERVRSALAERVAAVEPTLPRPPPSTASSLATDPDAVVMERVVVTADREKKTEVARTPNYLVRAFKTGDIYSNDRIAVRWGLSSASSTGYGVRSNTPRVSISASLRW